MHSLHTSLIDDSVMPLSTIPVRSGAESARSRPTVLLTFRVGLLLTVVIAAITRLPNLGKHSLNLNEGFTLTYARQPWPAVLGFDGFYAPHPPLFYTLVKLTNLAAPEVLAPRIVVALCGIASIAVFYALAARLLDERAALAASVIVVLSPIHFFYSRMDKLYAPVSLAVVASYLGLVAFLQTRQLRWAVVYGVALAAGPWLDYSAAYALAPQAVLLLVIVWRLRRASAPLFIAAAAAVVAYVPWVPQLVASVARLEGDPDKTDRNLLVPSWGAIRQEVRVLFGLDSYGTPGLDGVATLWNRTGGRHGWLLVALVPVLVVGLFATRRRLASLVAVLLAVGTPLAAVAMSLISPGFDARTVMAAVFGLALIAGAVFVRTPLPVTLRVVGIVGWCFLAVASSFGLPRIYEYGSRSSWPTVADDLAGQASLGKPVLLFSYAGVVTDLIDIYAGDRLAGVPVITFMDGRTESARGGERWLTRGLTLEQFRAGALDDLLPEGDPHSDAVWFVRKFGGKWIGDRLTRQLGYEHLTTVSYYDAQIDLYARPGAKLGTPVTVSGLSGSPRTGSGHSEYRSAVPGLYTLEVRVGAHAEDTEAEAHLTCRAADGRELREFTRSDVGIDAAGGEALLRVAVLCPTGTTALAIDLVRRGPSIVSFGDPQIYESPAGVPNTELDATSNTSTDS
jgi:hypothetical protein